MPSLFASLAAAASATVDAVFAEGFTIEARDAPALATATLANGRPDVDAPRVASAVRQAFGFHGVFVARGAAIHARGRAMADNTTHGMVTDQPMIDVDDRSLVERPQRGDIIRRNDTGERFRVTDPFKRIDFGRVAIMLTEA